MNTENTSLEYRPTLRERILWRLFPSQALPMHPTITGLPEWAQDAINLETTCHLDFADRLRVLITGKLVVKSRTYTAIAPGRVESSAIGYPAP